MATYDEWKTRAPDIDEASDGDSCPNCNEDLRAKFGRCDARHCQCVCHEDDYERERELNEDR